MIQALPANTGDIFSVPLPEQTKPAFTSAKDGLPIFHGETYEEHLEAWIHVHESIECRLWALGAIAASLEVRHGEGSIKQLCKDLKERLGLDVSKSRVYDLAKTYRAFRNSKRLENRSFHHHTIAAGSDDPEKAILLADDKGWSTREFQHFLETGLEPGEKSGINAVALGSAKPTLEMIPEIQALADQAMIDHCMKARLAVGALKAECPSAKFVADVYNNWEEEIDDRLEHYALNSWRDKVIHAWRNGCHEQGQIAAFTGIPASEISGVMRAYAREGLFEKVERSKTAMAKGVHPWVWHLVGEPLGSDYMRPR